MSCKYCGYGSSHAHVCPAMRTPCCGYDMTARSTGPTVIQWSPENRAVKCRNCGATFRMLQPEDGHVEGDEAFRLLALGERMAQLSEKMEGKFSTGAVVNHLQACRDALDAHEETEGRILRDAMDVLTEIWSD